MLNGLLFTKWISEDNSLITMETMPGLLNTTIVNNIRPLCVRLNAVMDLADHANDPGSYWP